MNVIIIGDKGNLANYIRSLSSPSIRIVKSNSLDHFSSLFAGISPDSFVSIIYTKFSRYSSPDAMSMNNYLAKNVIELNAYLDIVRLHAVQVQSFLITSSAAVYGLSKDTAETVNLSPLSFYGHTKLFAENIVFTQLNDYIPHVMAARIFNIYGGNDSFSIIHKTLLAYKQCSTITLNNNGNAVRDFIHVHDVSLLLLKLCSVSFTGSVNIGSGKGTSISQVLHIIEECSPSRCRPVLINKNNFEIAKSVADTKLLNSLVSHFDFISLKTFLRESMQVTKSSEQ